MEGGVEEPQILDRKTNVAKIQPNLTNNKSCIANEPQNRPI